MQVKNFKHGKRNKHTHLLVVWVLRVLFCPFTVLSSYDIFTYNVAMLSTSESFVTIQAYQPSELLHIAAIYFICN
jgi:hypothetical protein